MAIFGRGRESYQLIGASDGSDPIPEHEPCLLIRGQDEYGELMARIYATICRTHLHDPRMAESVEELAELMHVWPTKKRPDLAR